MINENQSNKENGIDKEIELLKSLKDKDIQLDKLLKEMNQSQKVEELLNRYGKSAKEVKDQYLGLEELDKLREQHSAEVNFEPLSNQAINPKREKIVKRLAYGGVAVFGFFLFFGVIGAYIDFYNYYTTNDADYLKNNPPAAQEVEN